MGKIEGLTGIFDNDEKILMEYTIQKINFKKRVLLLQRITACVMILIFIIILFTAVKMLKEDTELRLKYGSQYNCYKCGIETGKICLCQFISRGIDINNFLKQTAELNVMICQSNYNLTSLVEHE